MYVLYICIGETEGGRLNCTLYKVDMNRTGPAHVRVPTRAPYLRAQKSKRIDAYRDELSPHPFRPARGSDTWMGSGVRDGWLHAQQRHVTYPRARGASVTRETFVLFDRLFLRFISWL
jgi:hypothetical protein